MGNVTSVLGAGAGNLAAYLAAHVLLCLLPAFFITGAMAALIPKASITRWLGRNTPAHVSYAAAAAAGSLLAVAYTGSILGAEFAAARFGLSLLFGIGIGVLMARLFWRDDASHDTQTDALFADQATISPASRGVLLALVALLIA